MSVRSQCSIKLVPRQPRLHRETPSWTTKPKRGGGRRRGGEGGGGRGEEQGEVVFSTQSWGRDVGGGGMAHVGRIQGKGRPPEDKILKTVKS